MENLYSQFKLLKHADRLADWQNGKISQPIFAAFDLSDRCNNKCPQCVSVLTYGHGGGEIVSREDALGVIKQLGEYGVKGITFAGGGEPTCNPHLEKAIRTAKKEIGDVALVTNGLKLEDKIIEAVVDCCTWTRVSLDADSPELYLKTHGMPKKYFEKVVANILKLTETRERKGKKEDLTLGVTYLIGRHTAEGIYPAAKLAKNLGVDYIRFRPFFIWEGKEMALKPEETEKINRELKRCEELRTPNFAASYSTQRCNAMV
ncbi:MAG: radical SAM protein, partial [archaeon]|nr:radical SAM protein [archaeon]